MHETRNKATRLLVSIFWLAEREKMKRKDKSLLNPNIKVSPIICPFKQMVLLQMKNIRHFLLRYFAVNRCMNYFRGCLRYQSFVYLR